MIIWQRLFLMDKKFNDWNEVKKRVNQKSEIITFKQRDIYWANMGQNIGFEQNGKGNDFMRPVLVFRKLSKHIFFGIPLSTQPKEGSFFYNFSFLEGKHSNALLVQMKMYDVKRLDRRLGMISKDDFEKLELKMKGLMKW